MRWKRQHRPSGRPDNPRCNAGKTSRQKPVPTPEVGRNRCPQCPPVLGGTGLRAVYWRFTDGLQEMMGHPSRRSRGRRASGMCSAGPTSHKHGPFGRQPADPDPGATHGHVDGHVAQRCTALVNRESTDMVPFGRPCIRSAAMRLARPGRHSGNARGIRPSLGTSLGNRCIGYTGSKTESPSKGRMTSGARESRSMPRGVRSVKGGLGSAYAWMRRRTGTREYSMHGIEDGAMTMHECPRGGV